MGRTTTPELPILTDPVWEVLIRLRFREKQEIPGILLHMDQIQIDQT